MEKYCKRKEGCTWMFINIFGCNQKHFLMDKSKKNSGNNHKKKKQLESSNESVQRLIDENTDFSVSSDHEHVDMTKVCKNESEDKFSEIIKRLIAQKEVEIQTCKDLLEAFHVLDSEEEEEEKKKHQVISKQEAVLVSQTKCSFFRMQWRSEERRKRSQLDDSPSNKSRTGRCFRIGLIRRRRLQCSVEIQSKSEEHVSDEAEPVCNRRMSEDSKKIMSGLYIAAKKHLTEMLANGDIDVNLPDKEVPRILGKILSLPEFSSPADSPILSQQTEKPMIMQCGSSTSDMINEDTETLFSIDVSAPKDRDNQSSIKETFIQPHTSPPGSPPSSSVTINECNELSPVSVLEPLFTDDENSPTTSSRRFSSGEIRMQPLCIRFDEADDSRKPNKTGMDDKELTLAYIETVVKSSGLSWEELLTRSFNSEELLETIDEVVFCSTRLCDDKNLLHGCINEVLMDFCRNELNPGPWVSFLKPEVQLIADVEAAAKVAKEGVYWHLLPLPSPHTLDQIISKDMAKTGSWMDLRFDIGCIGSDTSEMILDELVEEVIRSLCRDRVEAEAIQDPNNDSIR